MSSSTSEVTCPRAAPEVRGAGVDAGFRGYLPALLRPDRGRFYYTRPAGNDHQGFSQPDRGATRFGAAVRIQFRQSVELQCNRFAFLASLPPGSGRVAALHQKPAPRFEVPRRPAQRFPGLLSE
jgi:hypothetical protein